MSRIAVQEQYRYIQVWGQICHYTDKQIANLIAQAREEHAPYDALFKRPNSGVWATFRTHMTMGYPISNEYVRVFTKNGWGTPVWADAPAWRNTF